MKLPKQPWWRTDTYDLAGLNDGPDMSDESLWGPKGPAVVPMFPQPDGGVKTGPGWGRDTFMQFYNRYEFTPRRVLHKYDERQQPFAWVMRSARLLCVDIDGKNGGFEHVSELGFLPPTLAEKSMSGNGYHLFYLVDDEWDPHAGFDKYRDVIGLVTGVDIRAVGCVYHKPTQQWNSRGLAQLPEHLDLALTSRQRKRNAAKIEIAKTLELDKEEIAIMHDEMLTELNKPIKPGTRNQTLFAIGSKMKQAECPGWEDAITERGLKIGLDEDELEKLIQNINTYGVD